MWYQTEALSWLHDNKNKAALAGNHFGTTANAIKAVDALYAAGAVRVDVIVQYYEASRIAKDGGPYADTLEVTFPKSGQKKLFAFIKSLEPDNLEDVDEPIPDTGPSSVWTLWWD